ncbi:hypothetical protein GCM10010178_63180 [Lentzea flava]|uniref:Uncharacterized protein n=1 Tax=Lentzea flava TaxID=103732 RepID=A0ABQ2UZZ2_9PSEU|nr:hypothetical protein GCM10010178_63180 [Lentzea flava]
MRTHDAQHLLVQVGQTSQPGSNRHTGRTLRNERRCDCTQHSLRHVGDRIEPLNDSLGSGLAELRTKHPESRACDVRLLEWCRD